jgi:5'-3' exonuclease
MLESKEIPLVYAKDEADTELAHGEFDYVVSSDSDMIVLGCPCLLVPKLTKHGVEHDMYRYADVKKAIGFDGEQLYELAFLAGCDVQPNPIVDIETAASWLRFYGSLAVIATKKKITEDHIKLYQHLRKHVWAL